jgi:L-alanine-DL-glutamate epimerase-like enolase superfamily enzyme
MESVAAQIEAARPLIEAGLSRHELQRAMPPGAARNAVDCALWDLEAKRPARRSEPARPRDAPQPLTTAFTISLGEPDVMAAQARERRPRALLKVKVGTPTMRAGSAPSAPPPPTRDHSRRQRRLAREHWNITCALQRSRYCPGRTAAAGGQGRDACRYRSPDSRLRR